jgi:hypothetical protein
MDSRCLTILSSFLYDPKSILAKIQLGGLRLFGLFLFALRFVFSHALMISQLRFHCESLWI